MSQQPPPPPYGGPPYGGPPSSYGGPPGPPSPYGGPPGERPPGGLSNTAKFWIGVLLTIPVFVVAALLTGGATSLLDATGADPVFGSVVSGIISMSLLAGFVVLAVMERTRWIALGILAGAATLLILAAGACVVLFIALANSYNGGM